MAVTERSTVDTDRTMWCERLHNADLILQARELVAQVYLAEGYVHADDIDHDGILSDHVDPCYRHSDYFAVGHGALSAKPMAVSRLVRHSDDLGPGSFPMLKAMQLDSEFEAVLAATDITSWVEVGSLAKDPTASAQAPNLLYRKMWQQAVREGHTTWLFAADYRVSRTLQNLFGDEVTAVGPRQQFMGSPTDALIMHPPTSADWLGAQAEASRDDDSMDAQLVRLALAFFLDGLEPGHFTEQQLHRFARGGVELRDHVVVDLTEDAPTLDLT